jgi:hypothetical protein
MSGSYVYDKSKYHMGEGTNYASSWETASAPALYILRWMIARNFLDDGFWDDARGSLEKYRAGEMSLFKLYEKECDLCLVDDMFTKEGNAFGQVYFDYNTGGYLNDLAKTLQYKGYPEFNEVLYQKVGPIIDTRYEVWKRPSKGLLRWIGKGKNDA